MPPLHGRAAWGVTLPKPPGVTSFTRTIDLSPRGAVTLPLVVRGVGGGDPQLGMNLVSVRIRTL